MLSITSPAGGRARNISFIIYKSIGFLKGFFYFSAKTGGNVILLHPLSVGIDIILSVDHLIDQHSSVGAAIIPFSGSAYPTVH